METALINNSDVLEQTTVSRGNFIEANTEQVSLQHLKNDCIIPVYSDNESTIAHFEFIEATQEVVESIYLGEKILAPNIRTSHVIRGRIPSAIGKPLQELRDDEKTIFYQRMAFMFEIPDVVENVNGNPLSLTIGGVRALNQENLYSKRTFEKFQVFIGFKNAVCTNLCISTDGLNAEIKVANVQELQTKIRALILNYKKERYLGNMERMSGFALNQEQVAHLLGKMKMHQFLSKEEKLLLPELGLNDNQINNVARGYFLDEYFSKEQNGDIDFWKLYNLMTDANKSSYIDTNLVRNVNAFEFVNTLAGYMENESGKSWFLI